MFNAQQQYFFLEMESPSFIHFERLYVVLHFNRVRCGLQHSLAPYFKMEPEYEQQIKYNLYKNENFWVNLKGRVGLTT